MKRVECVIRPYKLDNVIRKLHEIGITGVTAFEVKGFGRQKGRTERYRGSEFDVGFLPKVMLMMVVKDDAVAKIVEEVSKAAHTDNVGDGKIVVSEVEQLVRIRTGEKGEVAI